MVSVNWMQLMAVNLVKKILEDGGFTQRELSEKSEVSLATINQVCNQKIDVSPRTKSKILKGLNQLITDELSIGTVFVLPDEPLPIPVNQ